MALDKSAKRSGPVIDRSGPLDGELLADYIAGDADPDEFDGGADAGKPQAAAVEPVTATPARPPKVTASPLEPVLERILRGPHKAKFLLLADWFEAAVSDRGYEVSVKTNIGDVKFTVIDWIETPGFLKLVVDETKMPFRPDGLAVMDMVHKGVVYNTTCVYPLRPLFGDLPFREMILIVNHTTTIEAMEKDARVKAGTTPSAVSGKPSTGVDDDGEPVAEGEKSASIKGALPEQDFDVSRTSQDG